MAGKRKRKVKAKKMGKNGDLVLLIVEAPAGVFYYAWGGRKVPTKTETEINAFKKPGVGNPHVTRGKFGLVIKAESDVIDILGGDL